MTVERISPEQAAKVLRISPGRIRNLMKINKLPIGHYIPPAKGGINGQFFVYKHMVMEYLHLTEWPEEEKQNEA